MLLQNAKSKTEASDGEDGYLLLTVLVLVFLMLLWLSVAAPRVAKQIQRDKELETVHRGLQYRRAIQLYYKKFGSYPTDIKQLENTNQIRYLRKRYPDPMTGKDDWRLIHVGEAKVPPMGFFGQPLQAGLSSASTGLGLGTGPSIYSAGTTGSGTSDGSGGTTGTGSNGSSTSFGNSGSSSGLGSISGSGFGASSGSGFGSSSGSGFGSNGTNTGRGDNPGSNTTFGGGGPIVGVGVPLKKDSLIEYHRQKKYVQWEFVYDPQQDQVMGGGAGAGPLNGGNQNGSGTSNPVGTGFNNSGSGGSSGSGSGFGFGNSGSSGSSGSGGFGNSGSNGSSGSGGFGFGNSGSGGNSGSNPPSGPPSNPQQ